MSTRSSIAVQREDGSVVGVYCHFDGYPSHVGAILKKFYCDQDAAIELVEGGGLMSIQREKKIYQVCNMDGTIRGESTSKQGVWMLIGTSWSPYEVREKDSGALVEEFIPF